MMFFNSERYLKIEAERLSGSAVVLPSVGAGVILRSVPRTEYTDMVSVYGYPDLAQDDHAFSGPRTELMLNEMRLYADKHNSVAAYLRLGLTQEVSIPPELLWARLTDVGHVVVVDLQRSRDEIFSSFRKQLRRDLASEKFTIEIGTDVGIFHDIYIENMRRVGATEEYLFSLKYLDQICNIPGVTIYNAVDKNEVVGSAITIIHGKNLYYHLGATRTYAVSSSPMKHILRSIIMDNALGALDVFVLGGGVGGRDDPLLRFKRGFSKEMRPVHALRVIFDEVAYRKLSGLPVGSDLFQGYFPAYRSTL